MAERLNRLGARLGGMLLAGLLIGGQALAGNHTTDAADWLQRMDQAVSTLNYDGTLVHRTDGKVDTYRIVHQVGEGGVTERLTALDGVGREIITDPEQVMCIFPDRMSVVIEYREGGAGKQSPISAAVPAYSESARATYDFSVAESGRVAARQAVAVSIEPRDKLRYGFRLWLDERNAMLLKSQVIDEGGDVIEEVMFVSVDFPRNPSPERVAPSIDTTGFEVTRSGPAEAPAQQAADAGMPWQVTDLPTGFMMAAQRPLEASIPMAHMVYTDGLASVSVFVDMSGGAGEQAEGVSRVGMANAYSRVMDDGRLVTAVGQVPVATLRQIAVSVVAVE